MEMLILNKLKWKIYLGNPAELISQIFSDLIKLNLYNENYLNEIYITVIDLINFCFWDINIYKNFNQFLITVTCLIISFENFSEKYLSNYFYSFFKEKFNTNFSQNFQKCKINLVKKFFPNNNEEIKNFTEELEEKKFNFDENSLNNSKFSTLDN
jgi:hypothetical protein